ASRFRGKRQSGNGFDPRDWQSMAEAGWTAVLLPEEAGGMNLDIGAALSLAEAVGRNLISEPFLASGIIAATILGASDTGCAQALAQQLAKGEKIVVLADQEELGSIGPAAVQSKLERVDQDGLQLTGRKIFVPAWTGDTELLVSAILDDQPTIVAIDPRTVGIIADVQRMTD